MKRRVYDPASARIGFGTQSLRDKDILIEYLKEINKGGYDFLDCAWRYGNEAIIGLALKSIKKEDPKFDLNISFQSKVWPSQFYGGVSKSLKFSLQKIGAISILDSYMLHRPSQDMNLNMVAWRQLVECKRNRLVRKIGLGHFDKDLMEKMYENTGIRPHFLQIELSVNNMRWDRIYYCNQHDIEIQAYDPLGDYENNVKNPLLIKLAEKYETTIKNLLLAYLLNLGITPVVTPSNFDEIREFLRSKEIVIEHEDMELLNGINTYKNRHFEFLELDFKEES